MGFMSFLVYVRVKVASHWAQDPLILWVGCVSQKIYVLFLEGLLMPRVPPGILTEPFSSVCICNFSALLLQAVGMYWNLIEFSGKWVSQVTDEMLAFRVVW